MSDRLHTVPETAWPLAQGAAAARTAPELARVLRLLRQREACVREGPALTYRGLAAKTGWSRASIGEYLVGTGLPPADRFDQLVQILGATSAELGPLARARDRVEELRWTGTGTTAPAGDRMPRELPAPVPSFVGRRRELAELDRLAAAVGQQGNPAGGLVIAAICGARNVGKTALAVQWAHRRTNAFPDGQLYIDLGGSDPRSLLRPVDALGRFLHALGVDQSRLPGGVDERAAWYRTILAGRRALVVLDNAWSAEAVRPLLPGNANCMVIVTSRDSLGGLVAAEGARRVSLEARDAAA